MIYIEFFERDRFMPLEIFRFMGDHAGWSDPEDALFANLGRTMRIGPLPPNMAFWQCSGLERMDEWEAFFRSDEGIRDVHEQASLRTLHLKHGGCYDMLVEGPKPDAGLQYVEFFDPGPDIADDQIVAALHGARRGARRRHAEHRGAPNRPARPAAYGRHRGVDLPELRRSRAHLPRTPTRAAR